MGTLERGTWLVVGSLIVSFGASAIVREAFSNKITYVYLGVVVFFVGYQLLVSTVQKGQGLRSVGRRTRTHLHQWRTDPETVIKRYLIGNVGAFGVALGIQLFTTAIVQPESTLALLAGVSSFGGYVLLHRAVEGGFI